MIQELYISGDYLLKNPTWHVGESPWKAKEMMRTLERNNIAPKTICVVGCGAGEVLRLLQMRMESVCIFSGYEISPQAFELSKSRENERLQLLFTINQDLAERIFGGWRLLVLAR